MKKTILFVVLCMFVASFAYAQEKQVSRHQFSSAIVDREPADSLSSFTPAEDSSLCYFTELMSFEGEGVRHIWKINGETAFDGPLFTPTTPRWRTYTSMKSGHFKAGDTVEVQVVNEVGTVYATDTITIGQ
jgi:hypothetical protein